MIIRHVKLVLKLKNMVARIKRAYGMLQERVALKRRVRNNWARIRSQRQQLVSGQRSMLRRIRSNMSKAASLIAENLTRARADDGAPRSTRLGRASLAVLRTGKRALLRRVSPARPQAETKESSDMGLSVLGS